MTDVAAGPAGTPGAWWRNVGSRTLDRGIRALLMVAAAPGGLTVQEVADRLACTARSRIGCWPPWLITT